MKRIFPRTATVGKLMFRVSVFGLRLNAGGIVTEIGGSLVVEWVTKMSHNGTMETSASRAHNFIIFFGVFISETGRHCLYLTKVTGRIVNSFAPMLTVTVRNCTQMANKVSGSSIPSANEECNQYNMRSNPSNFLSVKSSSDTDSHEKESRKIMHNL